MKASERKRAAKDFSARWNNRGSERKDSQSFWLDLLHNVYGIENPTEYITFEDTVMMDNTSFLDGYIEKTNVLIEQKGIDRDLNKGIKQSDGSYLTPFQQAKRYSANLPYSRRPRWIITCNFKEFYIYDMEQPNAEPSIIKLENIETEYYRLEILVDKTNTQIEKETQVSIQAGELVGQIYDELLKQYKNPEDSHTLESINQLCVRLVFCFYAEDAGLFGKRGLFHDYLVDFSTRHFRNAIINLFHVLNTKTGDRDPYLDDKLASFPYVNGGLFEEMDIEVPQFTDQLRDLILQNASSEFNWSDISPTIFGGVFESTLNPEERRKGGMHYTSIENIHKVIDPLFLDDLKDELNEIKQYKQYATIRKRALEFQSKLADLTFFDPACGSGNFLTETYLSLRELENEALVLIYGDNVRLDTEDNLIKVTLDQFYGIEINDFAVSVAKTALWIAESQMFEKTKNLVYSEMDFLPLKSYTNIIEGNALRINWNDVIPSRKLNFIIGNPPFGGTKYQSKQQKQDIKNLCPQLSGIDYVSGWFYKSGKLMYSNPKLKTAFVSTNSITQGEQVFPLWNELINSFDLNIIFAHTTFEWKSETNNKASVHCVIIGLNKNDVKEKFLYKENQKKIVSNISPYLVEASNILIKKRTKPLCKVPKITKGSQPTDGGYLILNENEKHQLIKTDPLSAKYIKRYMGANDFINDNYRYCLWLKDCSPSELKRMPNVLKRLEGVKQNRLNSTKSNTRKKASIPYLFTEDRQPDSNYLIIPVVSSENRRYVPMGFVTPEIIANTNAQMVPNAELYHFGVLESNVHMSWMRLVAGRMKSDYAYSARIVYNNFPWPVLDKNNKEEISKTAKLILKARKLSPDSTLADLYDELSMPVELRKAHQKNDKAVMKAYGMSIEDTTESDSANQLLEMYNSLTMSESK